MKYKLFIGLGIVMLFLSSCAINYITFNANSRVKHVDLGMSKQQVIDIMGNLYIASAAAKDANEDLMEIISYKSDETEEYRFKFKNNKLISWDRIHINSITNENASSLRSDE